MIQILKMHTTLLTTYSGPSPRMLFRVISLQIHNVAVNYSIVMSLETNDPRDIFLAVRSHNRNMRISLPDTTGMAKGPQTYCHYKSIG